MSDPIKKNNEPEDLKEYADGWMTERKGTDVPGFLKLAFPVIGFGCVAYLVMQMYGDVSHVTRGGLVQKFNEVSQTSPGLMYFVTALGFIYVVAVVTFAIKKHHED